MGPGFQGWWVEDSTKNNPLVGRGRSIRRLPVPASRSHQVSRSDHFRCGEDPDAGAKLDLLQAGDVHMTLRRDPEVTTSGGVSLALALADGGEGNIVVGTSGSMYGAVRPLEGPVHYTLESCGQGCSVLIERASDWFNQFQD